MRSPRSWARPLSWLAATLTSIMLASVAMLPVLRTATGDDSGLITADQLRRSGTRAPIPLPSAPGAPSPRTPSKTTGAPASPSPSAPGSKSPSSRTSPAADRTTTPPPARTTPPPAADPESRVVDGWTVTTGSDGVDTYVRSFRVEGGQAVIRIRDGKAGVVSATPASGFEVATVQNSPENLAVYFNEQNHSFIVHAGWNVDRPFAQVDEIGS